MKLWLFSLRVDERCNKASAVCNHQLKRSGGCTFIMTGAVVRVPHQDRRNGSIHPSGHEESHTVFDFRMFDTDVGNNGVSDDGWDKSEEHDYSTQLQSIGENCDDYRDDGCYRIWYDGP